MSDQSPFPSPDPTQPGADQPYGASAPAPQQPAPHQSAPQQAPAQYGYYPPVDGQPGYWYGQPAPVQYPQPDFGQPSYGQPNYAQSNFAQQNPGQPNYDQPNYEQPNYDQPAYHPTQPVYGQAPWPPAYQYGVPAQAPQPAKQHRGRKIVAGVSILCLVALGGVALGNNGLTLPAMGNAAVADPGSSQSNGSQSDGGQSTDPFGSQGSNGSGSGGYGGFPFGGSGNGSDGTGRGTTSSTGTASESQQVGVVDINTVLGYQQAEAAGTGMVLTADGEILTNNHVVAGATSIKVTVVSTGRSYTASVVGTDATDDVAVLKLTNASGLATAKLSKAAVKVGDSVTAVGNAGGAGGTPSAATGSVTALGQTITATDEDGSHSETLNNLIETDANVQAGDSGGPLYNSSGTVIGMDTAASSSNSPAAASATRGYAIPIADAVAIAGKIAAGQSSSTIQIGTSGFLGIALAADSAGSSAGGVVVGDVVQNGPAATAGIVGGDTITSVNGKSVSSASGLTSLLSSTKAGDRVSVTWVDASGQSHKATVTLAAAPAQ